MTKRDLFYLIIIVVLGSCKTKDNTYHDNAVVTANEAIIAHKDSIIAAKDTIIAQLQRRGTASVQKQSDITKSFKPVYAKIHTDTSLVAQWNYLQVLLAESKRTPLNRD